MSCFFDLRLEQAPFLKAGVVSDGSITV